jgi:hypothetical protein
MKYDVRTAIKASPYLEGIANVPCKHFAHGRDARVAEERNPAVEETFRVLSNVDVASTAQNVSVLRNRNAKERHTLNIPSNEFSLQGEIAPKLLNKLTGHLENKK